MKQKYLKDIKTLAQGTLIGGNLTYAATLLYSPYFPDRIEDAGPTRIFFTCLGSIAGYSASIFELKTSIVSRVAITPLMLAFVYSIGTDSFYTYKTFRDKDSHRRFKK